VIFHLWKLSLRLNARLPSGQNGHVSPGRWWIDAICRCKALALLKLCLHDFSGQICSSFETSSDRDVDFDRVDRGDSGGGLQSKPKKSSISRSIGSTVICGESGKSENSSEGKIRCRGSLVGL